jgi:predicted permease
VAIVPEGFQLPAGKDTVSVLAARVDDNYFGTMGIPLVSGRGFRAEDSSNASRVGVINQQLAQHYWPGQDPIGKRFRLTGSRGGWVEIVGVAKTTKYLWLMEPPTDFLYLPRKQHSSARMVLLAESIGDPASLVAPLREVARGLDANQPIYNVRTMEGLYRMRTTSTFNVIDGTVAALGLMGLGLAIVGLYGLVSYAASRRTREIGIRMAIGAERGDVLRLVLRQGTVLALAGLAVGLVASLGATQVFRALFPGGRGIDLVGLSLVSMTVLTVTLVAAYIPARRASRLDPNKALRYE